MVGYSPYTCRVHSRISFHVKRRARRLKRKKPKERAPERFMTAWWKHRRVLLIATAKYRKMKKHEVTKV